jgi:uncharacterized membrane protein YfcA
MTRGSRARRSRQKKLTDDQRRQRRAESVLVLCVGAYLGLAVGIMFFPPDEPWLSWILLFFAVHTAGYLVVTHIKEKRGGKLS